MEPTVYGGWPIGTQQRAATGSRRVVVAFILVVLVLALVASGLFWLQWASQRGITLGYPAPHVHITSSPSSSLLINQSYQFSANGNGRDLNYSWDFGDQGTASGPSVSHIYQSSGNFTVTVTVTDAVGHTSTDTTMVNVASPPPTASFTFSVGFSGYVSFDASASSADPSTSITNYIWDFGDGSNDNTPSAQDSHTYSSSGTYTVTLTVTDGTNQQSQPYTATVTI